MEPAFSRLDALHQAVTAAIDDSRSMLSGEEPAPSAEPPAPPTLQGLARTLRAEARSATSVLEASRAAREHSYYKVVAKFAPPKGCKGEPKFVSIFDGVTQFRRGERAVRTPCQGRRGAFFVFRDLAAAREVLLRGQFPASSRLLHAPRAVLRVRSDEPPERTVHGCKALVWSLTPVEEVALPATPTTRWPRERWRAW